MKKLLHFLSMGAFLVVVSGCSYQFDIIVGGLDSGSPVFNFSKPLMVSPKWIRNQVDLNSFRVVEKKDGNWDYKNPMWAFGLKPGAALVVEHIRYGALPDGFVETSKAKTLEVGIPYMAIGFGLGSGGSKEFMIAETR